jgi:two-component system sensor histidine kinase BaeS
MLASQKVVVQPGRFWAPWQDRYWVRLDEHGKPIAAARIDFTPDHMPQLSRHLLSVAGVWVLLLGLLLVPPLYLWVIRPLRRMQQVAQRLGQGDLATPVSIDRQDEFGELQQTFETMRQQIAGMLAQRERLLWDISHELRGPLSRMAIAIPLLQDEYGPSPYLQQLQRDMSAMDALVGEVLALGRGQSAEQRKQPVDLAAIADDLLAERAITLGQRALTLEKHLEAAPLQGDPALLARAMGNLLDNAIKYTPDPGQIRLETGREAGEVFFRVANSGPGIAPEHLPHVFEPFYRPDSSRSRETGGTGLGLSIAEAIAERHGGQAHLRSEPGRTTTAELRFPITE